MQARLPRPDGCWLVGRQNRVRRARPPRRVPAPRTDPFAHRLKPGPSPPTRFRALGNRPSIGSKVGRVRREPRPRQWLALRGDPVQVRASRAARGAPEQASRRAHWGSSRSRRFSTWDRLRARPRTPKSRKPRRPLPPQRGNPPTPMAPARAPRRKSPPQVSLRNPTIAPIQRGQGTQTMPKRGAEIRRRRVPRERG